MNYGPTGLLYSSSPETKQVNAANSRPVPPIAPKEPTRTSIRVPHLLSICPALILATLFLIGGYYWARDMQERRLHTAAPEFCDSKLHGVALIREALSRPDTLVFFGSSELIPDVPMKGVDFFANSPTGFSMFPVGKAGTTALSVLQKLGGAAEELKGKKLVLSLSPSFYQSEQIDPKYFEGNSSKLQIKEFLWSDRFSRQLKRDVAEEILKYPKVSDGDWSLEFTLQRIASGTPADRLLLALIQPYAAFDRMVGRIQDHLEAGFALNNLGDADTHTRYRPKRGNVLHWDDLFRAAEQHSETLAAKSHRRPIKVLRAEGTWDKQFAMKVSRAQEWRDLELVLRLLREAGAKPLVISMPLHADLLAAQGVSKIGREAYGEQLHEMTKHYDVPLVYLKDHESDPIFFVDQNDHIGSKGWWYYDKVLDDFYHDRLSKNSTAQETQRPE
ncbi:MAG: D-alanyl-lipoteichoic acid biosynthesis protein DltD [Verrucomicrobiota bacterium]